MNVDFCKWLYDKAGVEYDTIPVTDAGVTVGEMVIKVNASLLEMLIKAMWTINESFKMSYVNRTGEDLPHIVMHARGITLWTGVGTQQENYSFKSEKVSDKVKALTDCLQYIFDNKRGK